MTNKELALLLGEIKGDEKHKLLGQGKQYLELMNSAIVKGYLTCDKEKLALTDSGSKYLIEERTAYIKKENWIEKDTTSMIPKLKKQEIFVPDQEELTF